MNRMVIYASDIQDIMGKGKTYSFELLKKIRQDLNKPPNHVVTVREFCDYKGFNYKDTLKFIHRRRR